MTLHAGAVASLSVTLENSDWVFVSVGGKTLSQVNFESGGAKFRLYRAGFEWTPRL